MVCLLGLDADGRYDTIHYGTRRRETLDALSHFYSFHDVCVREGIMPFGLQNACSVIPINLEGTIKPILKWSPLNQFKLV